MRGGSILIASASIGGIALVAWGTMSRVSHDIDEAFAFGGVPSVPEGLAAVRKPGGKRVAAHSGQGSHKEAIARSHGEASRP